MTDTADAARLIDALVSRRSGVVTDLSPQMRGPDEPSPPHLWNATLAHQGLQNTPLAARLTGGKGLTEAAAKLSAIGEAIERYCAQQWDRDRIYIGPAPDQHISPTECVLYSDRQRVGGLPYQPWTPEHPTSWIAGTELPSGTPVALPASLVYLVGAPPRVEDYFTATTSNGLAAGKNLSHAILGGAYEVIERDAFMLTWLNQLPATTITTPKKGCAAAQIIRHYNRFGVAIRLLSLFTDQAPHVVMAVADDPYNGGVFRMVGLGCDINPVAAVDKAMFELCQLRPGMMSRMHANDYKTRLTSYDAVRTIDDHPLFHAIPEHSSEFDFLTQTGAKCDLDDLAGPDTTSYEDAVALISKTAAETGARMAYADITAPDIAPLGPRVVRVIITGLQPIHFGAGQARLGGARLYEAPVKWGFHATSVGEPSLNQCPHPLA